MLHALDLRSQLLQNFEQASMIEDENVRQGLLNIVIAGAGPTGVELAGALSEMRKHILHHDYPGIDFGKMNIYVVEGLDRVLPAMSAQSSKKAHGYLLKMGIDVNLKTLVESYDGEIGRLSNGNEIPTQMLIWLAGVSGIILD